MGRARERVSLAREALASLEALPLPAAASEREAEEISDIVRDAAIQRFEYTTEAIWKAAQAVLRDVEGIEVGSPKAAIRACFRTGLLGEDDARALLSAIDDRNLTVHTYNRELAMAIFRRLGGHAARLHRWLEALDQALENSPGG